MDWVVTYYDADDNVISTHTIDGNRTEHQAEHEALADMPEECEDWTLVREED